MHRIGFKHWTCVISVLLCASLSAAQRINDTPRVRQLHRLAEEAFARTDYPTAEAHLNELVEIDGENFVVFYNLACARALQDDVDTSINQLAKAIALGFSDLGQLKSDPHLDTIRSDKRYDTLIARWDEIVALQAKERPKQLRRGFESYDESRDEAYKLTYLSSFDEITTDIVKAELDALATWATAELFTNLARPDPADAWVTVILPTQEDFSAWRLKRYGSAGLTETRQIGGSYLHDEKMLITADLGGSLRHEFFHVLHWRSMVRLRQFHPMWIQEGIGSLIEDSDPTPDGSLVPVPSWRTNIVRNLARNGNLLRLEELSELTPTHFSNRSPLANYAQARGFFLFLVERGMLSAWYEKYTSTFQADKSGLKAAIDVLGYEDLRELNKEYRAWARALPQVPEQLRPPPVALGFETAETSGDGMIVTGIYTNSARRAGLRLDDVVTSIEGMPVRDINELLRRLGGRRPGETITLGVRRGSAHDEVRVVLQPRQ